ncbi:UBN2_3 domain-containing protein, partial [Cephalotus follicularis]
ISNISNLIPIKLNGSNYLLWKSLFEPVLRRHNLMQFLNGTYQSPPVTCTSWYKKDQTLLSWINATLSKAASPYVVGVTLSKQAWDILGRRYASSTPSHIMGLKRQLYCIKKGYLSMHDYLQQIKTLTD